jgi:hypothetical protein
MLTLLSGPAAASFWFNNKSLDCTANVRGNILLLKLLASKLLGGLN